MYLGIDTTLFQDVQGVEALLSAAEMLKDQTPGISGAFVKLAAGLIENFLAQTGSTPELDTVFASLRSTASDADCASAVAIERYADALVASADGHFATEFYRIAYLAYNAVSLFGQLPSRIIQKLSKMEKLIEVEEKHLYLTCSSISSSIPFPSDLSPSSIINLDPNATQPMTCEPPKYHLPDQSAPPLSQNPYLNTESNLKKTINNNAPQNLVASLPYPTIASNNEPTTTSSSDSFYPSVAPNIYPNSTNPQKSDNQHEDESQIDENKKVENTKAENKAGDNKTVEELAELAKNAFTAGHLDIAFTAMNAAINELENNYE